MSIYVQYSKQIWKCSRNHHHFKQFTVELLNEIQKNHSIAYFFLFKESNQNKYKEYPKYCLRNMRKKWNVAYSFAYKERTRGTSVEKNEATWNRKWLKFDEKYKSHIHSFAYKLTQVFNLLSSFVYNVLFFLWTFNISCYFLLCLSLDVGAGAFLLP